MTLARLRTCSLREEPCGTLERDYSNYGTFNLDHFTAFLFSICTRLPVRNALRHVVAVLRHPTKVTGTGLSCVCKHSSVLRRSEEFYQNLLLIHNAAAPVLSVTSQRGHMTPVNVFSLLSLWSDKKVNRSTEHLASTQKQQKSGLPCWHIWMFLHRRSREGFLTGFTDVVSWQSLPHAPGHLEPN